VVAVSAVLVLQAVVLVVRLVPTQAAAVVVAVHLQVQAAAALFT
jgi:hypothetical protein